MTLPIQKTVMLVIVLAASLQVTTVPAQQPLAPTPEQVDYFGITNPDKLSAATKRALQWKTLGNQWYVQFATQDLKGDLAYEEGVVRRDPSAIIKEDGRFYVWYSRSVGPSQGFGGDVENDKVWPWDRCDLWYATSTDGVTWKEEGLAVPRGERGAYDDRSVFTCEIMKFDGKYYLCYQTVKSPYTVRVKNQVGLAWADSPDGPWTKSGEPILSPADNGIWQGDEQNRFLVEKKGDFDSHKVHDPCIVPFKGKFHLYYKGEQMGEEINFGGRMIRHGVAIAESPCGPYIKSPYNPISNSGHEVCVWPYNGGIASLITTDGPERNTIQWSPDGINFEIMSHIQGAPHAIGLNRNADNEKEPTEILRWGLTHQYRTGDYQYIRRFTSSHISHHTAKGEDVGKSVIPASAADPVADPGQVTTDTDAWIDLFNGKNLDGWTVKIAGHPMGENYAETFRVEDGIIKCEYDDYQEFDGRYGHLFSVLAYSHYILKLEYRFVGRMLPDAPGYVDLNSGVMLHSQPPQSMELDQGFPASLEMQFLADLGTGRRQTGNVCTPGTHLVYDGTLTKQHIVKSSGPTLPADQWVGVEMEVRGHDEVIYRVEGKEVLRYRNPQLDPDSKEAKPILARGADLRLSYGHIALQAEGQRVWFRNIRLLPLSDE